MTCVVGLIKDGIVYIGGDSAGTTENDMDIYQTDKVFTRPPFIFGGAGSYRGIQLLKYELEIPELIGYYNQVKDEDNYNPEAFMHLVTEVVRKTFKDKGHTIMEANNELQSTQALIGFDGHLYLLDVNFVILEPKKPFTATGKGLSPALGSLYSTEEVISDPVLRLLKALKSSEYYTPGVKRPFHIMAIKDGKTVLDEKYD